MTAGMNARRVTRTWSAQNLNASVQLECYGPNVAITTKWPAGQRQNRAEFIVDRLALLAAVLNEAVTLQVLTESGIDAGEFTKLVRYCEAGAAERKALT